MATFALTGANKWDDATFSTRAGNDSYQLISTENASLTIDCDTRYCKNSSGTVGSIGAVSFSANNTSLLIDGSAVRLIPFNTGSGNVPNYDTVISQGGVSGPLLGVWSALNTTPTAVGAAMPASGYIKVRSVSGGAFAAGALTGIGAAATGADVVGWIEVIGIQGGATINGFDKRHSVTIQGALFAVGTTPATPAVSDTYQLPASVANTWYPGVYVEQTAGEEDWLFWPAVNWASSNTFATDERAKVCWISSAGVLRFGADGLGVAIAAWLTGTSYAIADVRTNGGNTYQAVTAHTSGTFATDLAAGKWVLITVGGMLPPANCAIKVGNVLLQESTAGSASNAVPHTTLASRPKFSASNGDLSISHVSSTWTMSGVANLSGTYVGVFDGLALASLTTDIQYGGSGQASTNLTSAAVSGTCRKTTTIKNFTGTSGFGSSTVRTFSMRACGDVTLMDCKAQAVMAKAAGGILAFDLSSASILAVDRCVSAGAGIISTTSPDVVVRDYKYSDNVVGITLISAAGTVASMTGSNCTLDGLTWLASTADSCHPYSAVIASDGSTGLTLRNIGSAGSYLDLGDTNKCASLAVLGQTNQVINIRLQRIYVKDPRTSTLTLTNLNGLRVDNLYTTGDPAIIGTAGVDGVYRSWEGKLDTASISITAGYHFVDIFTSATAGLLIILANQKTTTPESAASYTLGSPAASFTQNRTVTFETTGASVTWETQKWIRGHTGFGTALATIEAGGVVPSVMSLEYDLNKGSGYSGAFKYALLQKLTTALTTAPSRVLTFDSTTDVTVGDYVYGTNIPAETTVASKDATTVTISADPTGSIANGAAIRFNSLPNETGLNGTTTGFKIKIRATAVTGTSTGWRALRIPTVTDASARLTLHPLEEIYLEQVGALTGSSCVFKNPGDATAAGFFTVATGSERVTYFNEDGTAKSGGYAFRKAGYGEIAGTWAGTTSWVDEPFIYPCYQALAEATVSDSGGITFVGDTSATLGANKTFQQLYSNSQHWSCLEANMLFDIPVISGGNGAYTANVDVVATGYTLNGSGSLAMGSNTLTANDSFTYTYTGGTFSQATTVPTFSGGTLNIGAAGTYTFTQAASMTVSATPTAPSNYVLSDSTFTGTLNFRNTSAHDITVEIPSGVTANSTGSPGAGTVTFIAPVVTADISITSMPDTIGANNRLQIINTTAIAAPDWEAATTYAAGDIVLRTSGIGSENTAGLYMRCTTAGTSHATTEPTWDTTVGNTTADNTVVWTTYAVLYYDADPAATSLTDTYIDGEEFLAGETVEIRFSEEDPAVSFKTYSTSVIATADGFSALVNEEDDPSYATYATSGVTQDSIFSPNFVANYIVLDTDTNFTGSGAYAYYCYLLTTSEGMYRFWGGLTGIDPGNIRNNVSIVSLYFDCSSGFVRQTDDIRIFRSDGLRPALDPVTAVGGGIEINWKVPVNVVTTGGSALTPTESAQLMALPSASITADAVWAKTLP